MSNGRIFCTGFSVFAALSAMLAAFGVETTYTGIADLIARAWLSALWGCSAVAMFGDRP